MRCSAQLSRSGAPLIRDRQSTCSEGPGSAAHHCVLRCARGTSTSILPRHDLLALLAEALDAERHHVADLEKDRVWLHAEPDAGRRAGDDDVARVHDEELRAVPDDVLAIEDHRFGIAALTLLAVDVEPHV